MAKTEPDNIEVLLQKWQQTRSIQRKKQINYTVELKLCKFKYKDNSRIDRNQSEWHTGIVKRFRDNKHRL